MVPLQLLIITKQYEYVIVISSNILASSQGYGMAILLVYISSETGIYRKTRDLGEINPC